MTDMDATSRPAWRSPLTPPTNPHPQSVPLAHQFVFKSTRMRRWVPSIISRHTSQSADRSAASSLPFDNAKSIPTAPAVPRECDDRGNVFGSLNGSYDSLVLPPRHAMATLTEYGRSFCQRSPSPANSLNLVGPLTANNNKQDDAPSTPGEDHLTSLMANLPSTQEGIDAFPSPYTLSQMLLTSNLISDLKRLFPTLLTQQEWDRPTAHSSYAWALQNPRVALLLYMTNNLYCWPVAAIFSSLADSLLPLTHSDVSGIVSNPMAVLDMQWRIIPRALPPTGAHIQLRSNESPPVTAVNSSRFRRKFKTESIVMVRWKSERSKVYALKSVQCREDLPWTDLLDQTESFKKLQHKNIIDLRCTYASGDSLHMLMPFADCNLEVFLRSPCSDGRADILRAWLVDLIGALEYIHSSGIQHRSIRPSKILIINDRPLFGAFGIGESAENELAEVSQGLKPEVWKYSAPEVMTRCKYFRASDVFALGCVFLEMMTVIKGQTVESLHSFTGIAGEGGFHDCLDEVFAWIQILEARAGFGLRDEFMSDGMAVTLISWMVDAEHPKRPKAGVLSASFHEWNFGRCNDR